MKYGTSSNTIAELRRMNEKIQEFRIQECEKWIENALNELLPFNINIKNIKKSCNAGYLEKLFKDNGIKVLNLDLSAMNDYHLNYKNQIIIFKNGILEKVHFF